jgi:NADH-quinone oxidoreductase subunit C
MDAASACDKIHEKFPRAVKSRKEFRGEHTLDIDPDSIQEVCLWSKETLGFDYLADISSVDHMGEDPRFEVVYELYSMKDRIHLRLKVQLAEDEPEVESVVPVWATANWHEREVWDMMGIRFRHHPDLRRILMWDGYPYHPLRKDFPLAGLPSEMPDVAFSDPAPLEGGPFVASPTSGNTQVREPRAREVSNLSSPNQFIAEP